MEFVSAYSMACQMALKKHKKVLIMQDNSTKFYPHFIQQAYQAEIGLLKGKTIKVIAEGQEEAGRVRNVDGTPQEEPTVTDQ
jgi:hypothetical protein